MPPDPTDPGAGARGGSAGGAALAVEGVDADGAGVNAGTGADIKGAGVARVVAVPDITIKFCCVCVSTVPSCAAIAANGWTM